MYIEGQVKISRVSNGYMMSMQDPAIIAANKSRDLSRDCCDCPPYRDPEVVYVFDTVEELTKFLSDNIDKALPKADYSSSFKLASAAAAATRDK